MKKAPLGADFLLKSLILKWLGDLDTQIRTLNPTQSLIPFDFPRSVA